MRFVGTSAAIFLVVGTLLLTGGCGQTGALYLPEDDRAEESVEPTPAEEDDDER